MSVSFLESNSADKASIALVSYDTLGDGLIHLMMADNLQRNGFDVTCYGNIACQLRAWLPELRLMPYPPADKIEAELSSYDFAIVILPGFIHAGMDEAAIARMRENWLLITQRAPRDWHFDHTETVRRKVSPEKFRQLHGLLQCSASLRFCKFANESAVTMAMRYMQEQMRLENVRKRPALVVPNTLRHRRYAKRVVVSPDSAVPEKKNWRPAAFLLLCRRLQTLGYTPEIVVAPKNHAAWVERAAGMFPTPRFDDIGDLAAYLYESGIVVANDSGNGHLASFLGIPVVTIYRKNKPRFYWRPDWEPGIVVCPPFSCGALWKYLIRPAHVISAIKRLQQKQDR
jgi:ADP-heptose:LPS heptosyltransferase